MPGKSLSPDVKAALNSLAGRWTSAVKKFIKPGDAALAAEFIASIEVRFIEVIGVALSMDRAIREAKGTRNYIAGKNMHDILDKYNQGQADAATTVRKLFQLKTKVKQLLLEVNIDLGSPGQVDLRTGLMASLDLVEEKKAAGSRATLPASAVKKPKKEIVKNQVDGKEIAEAWWQACRDIAGGKTAYTVLDFALAAEATVKGLFPQIQGTLLIKENMDDVLSRKISFTDLERRFMESEDFHACIGYAHSLAKAVAPEGYSLDFEAPQIFNKRNATLNPQLT